MLAHSLSKSLDLPADVYGVEVDCSIVTRSVLLPPETIVVFRVLDPEPSVPLQRSRHPHKGFTGRTVSAWFALADENPESRYAAECRLALLSEAIGMVPGASLESMKGKRLRVRVERATSRRDPSKTVAEAVEFLPL